MLSPDIANQTSSRGPTSSTSARASPSPNTPVKSETTKSADPSKANPKTGDSESTSSTSNPPAKRKRRTATEIEADNKEKEEKKKEREESIAAKVAEKAAEKAKAEEERAERLAIKAVERAKAEEEKAAKAKEREEKKKKKEEEQQRLQDEKDRKARSQMKLASFFKVPSTPKKPDGSPAKTQTPKGSSPVKPTPKPLKSEYEKMFHPFFVKENTRLATLGPQMDEETREFKSRILDEHFSGKRDESSKAHPFDAVNLFALPGKPLRRGKLHHPVRHIMEQVYKETEQENDSSKAQKIMSQARQKLARVPMKIIAFSQDVRPPYHGTVTFKPFALGKGNMNQVARNPTGRILPLEYDYDSEAEWQEEEGEDIDVDDDEEELDDEDDMEGFLDDSEDAGLARGIIANTLEPDNTGICFEDSQRKCPSAITYEHKMEFIHGKTKCSYGLAEHSLIRILEGLEQTWGIDPFSTQYWEPEPKIKPGKKAQVTTADSSTKMAPPPPPANAFAALTAGASGASGASGSDSLKLVKSEIMNGLKQAILDNKALSKVGIIDFLYHQFRDDVSRTEVKNTLELVAEKVGAGRQKAWTLKPGHEIVS